MDRKKIFKEIENGNFLSTSVGLKVLDIMRDTRFVPEPSHKIPIANIQNGILIQNKTCDFLTSAKRLAFSYHNTVSFSRHSCSSICLYDVGNRLRSGVCNWLTKPPELMAS